MTDNTSPPELGDNAPAQPRGSDPFSLGTGVPVPTGPPSQAPAAPPSGLGTPPASSSPPLPTPPTPPAPPTPPSVSPPAFGPETTPLRRPTDPLAAALGNATLLGVGYLLLRRHAAAFGAILTTVLLVLLLAALEPPGWFWRGALVVWGIVTISHGWRLAARTGGAPRPGRQRAIAAGAAVVVVLAGAAVAIDARRIGASAARSHEAGDCAQAIETLNGIGAWHRVVDPFVSRRAGDEVGACTMLLDAQADDDPAAAAALLAQYLATDTARWPGAVDLRADLLLAAAEDALDAALQGDMEQLESGFDLLAVVLTETPNRAEAVAGVLTGYVAALPDADPCQAMENLEWLDGRSATGDQLDAAADEAAGIAPPVFVACGDELLTSDPEGSLVAYQTVLDRYPDHELADSAQAGVNNAETNIEAKELRALFGASPRYCSEPAPFRGAKPYRAGGGPHLLTVVGSPRFAEGIPTEWRALDPTQATLVLCVDGPDEGSVLRSCSYEGGWTVSLRATTFEVQAFEVRTATVAFETTVTLGGDCPDPLRWECPGLLPNCPPPGSVRAVYGTSAIRNAVSPWVLR